MFRAPVFQWCSFLLECCLWTDFYTWVSLFVNNRETYSCNKTKIAVTFPKHFLGWWSGMSKLGKLQSPIFEIWRSVQSRATVCLFICRSGDNRETVARLFYASDGRKFGQWSDNSRPTLVDFQVLMSSQAISSLNFYVTALRHPIKGWKTTFIARPTLKNLHEGTGSFQPEVMCIPYMSGALPDHQSKCDLGIGGTLFITLLYHVITFQTAL